MLLSRATRHLLLVLIIIAANLHSISTQAARKSRCGTDCDKYGTCNEELGRCDCPRHRNGTNCEVELDAEHACQHHHVRSAHCRLQDPKLCLNACNARGTCIAGFCKCDAGFWGTDCALSYSSSGAVQLLAGQGYRQAAGRPLVYVYELPPAFNVWWHPHQLDRPQAYLLWQRLLSAGHRTADGERADWFYVPVSNRLLNGRDRQLHRSLVDYLSTAWPYWNRTQGWRHLFVATNDYGRIEMSPKLLNQTANSTWLHMWGLTRKHAALGEPAHRPDKDIVLPVLGEYSLAQPLLSEHNPLAPRMQRNTTLFFAGGICGWMDREGRCTEDSRFEDTVYNYSAGVRQKVFKYFQHLPGYDISGGHSPQHGSFEEGFASSKFCLAPAGRGHGKRGVLAALMGCVPVLIQDHVAQPFEPFLDWGSFSVRVSEAEVRRLDQVLAGVSAQELGRKQAALRCASLHLRWSSMLGGTSGEDGSADVFATLMHVLRVKGDRPGLKPHQYAQQDPAFRSFINCEEQQYHQQPPPAQLCTASRAPPQLAPTPLCTDQGYWYGHPGGAVCHSSSALSATCPHSLRGHRDGPDGSSDAAGGTGGVAGTGRTRLLGGLSLG